MPTPETRIESFNSHFMNHIEKISTISDEGPFRDYKKELFLSVLDGISIAVYPHKNNRERITCLLQNFSEWKYGDRVSLPHLQKLVSRNPDPAFEELRAFVQEELMKWPHGQHVYLNSDPSLDEVNKLWPQDKGQKVKIDGKNLDYVQHWNLLYSYRNSLVHSLQVPGFGLDELGWDEPFYIRVTMEENTNNPLSEIYHLSYPVNHFWKLCNDSLKNVNKHLIQNQIDPLQFFQGGSYFLDALNQP